MRRTKIAITVITALVMCFVFTACGETNLSGEPTAFQNSAKSFSIDLPSSGDDSWTVKEKTGKDVLDVTDKTGAVQVQVQGLSKTQTQAVAKSLKSYKEYALENIFTKFNEAAGSSLTETEVETPDFVKECKAYSYEADGTKGIIAFMESPMCYYTILVTATDEAYTNNEDAIKAIFPTLKESN